MKTILVTVFCLIGSIAYSQLSMLQIIELRKINDKSTFGTQMRVYGDYTYVKDGYIMGFEEDGAFATYAYRYTNEWGHPWAPIWVYKNFNTGDIFYRTSFDELQFFAESLSGYSVGIQDLQPKGTGFIKKLNYNGLMIALFFINSSKDYYVYIT